MARRNFDPTSVAARRLEAEKRQAHRIKLKKNLEKARKRIEGSPSAVPETLRPGIDAALSSINASEEASSPSQARKVRATTPPKRPSAHSTSKPDPMQRAVQRREERLQQMRQVAEAREREIMEAQNAKVKRLHQRERLHSKLTATNKRGQPKLANHIDALLHKIQKRP